ncbi:MAG: hypothetical protein U0R69_14825 [Gaiellales bacterium]
MPGGLHLHRPHPLAWLRRSEQGTRDRVASPGRLSKAYGEWLDRGWFLDWLDEGCPPTARLVIHERQHAVDWRAFLVHMTASSTALHPRDWAVFERSFHSLCAHQPVHVPERTYGAVAHWLLEHYDPHRAGPDLSTAAAPAE